MSMRLALQGFNLAHMRSLFGCRDQTLIARLEDKLRDTIEKAGGASEGYGQDFCERFRSALRHVVEVGVPVHGLEEEELPHVLLARWLAEYHQDHFRTNCEYKHWALFGFLLDYGDLLTPPAREFFGYLVDGRPLFGKRFGGVEPYGYLALEEASQLQARFEALLNGDFSNRDDQELAEDFAQYLDEIHREGLDIWAYLY